MKKYIYIFCTIALAGWVVFRFATIGSENDLYVFNPTRVAIEQGAPVDTLEVYSKTDVLKEPLYIKNNRALVSGARVGKFSTGQKVEGGEIISVAGQLDLDTGMYIIRTKGATDGLNYALAKGNGFFVPVYAINNGTVMIVEDGIARVREVKIARQDSDTAMITQGLSDGDIVILSKINDGEKVKFQNN